MKTKTSKTKQQLTDLLNDQLTKHYDEHLENFFPIESQLNNGFAEDRDEFQNDLQTIVHSLPDFAHCHIDYCDSIDDIIKNNFSF